MRSFLCTAVLVSCFLFLAGCESSPSLPYAPAVQPTGLKLAAGCTVLTDKLQVVVDSQGLPVRSALIVLPDGRELPPQSIQHPTRAQDVRLGVGNYAGNVHRTSEGLGMGSTTVDQPYTYLWYPLRHVGQGPWKLRLQVSDREPVEIELMAPAAK